MKNLCNIFILLLLSSISACGQSKKSNNLALNKPYILSELPNYKLSAPSTNKTALTDGIFTKGHFWTKKTTVGWQNKKRIEISIDLGKTSSVGAVQFYTAGGVADVHFPKHIYIFLADAQKRYEYVGDASFGQDKSYGTYQNRTFTLKDINSQAQYVTLVIIPEGSYLFCDEITVLHGENTVHHSGKNNLIGAISNTVDSLQIQNQQWEVLGNWMQSFPINLKLPNFHTNRQSVSLAATQKRLTKIKDSLGLVLGAYYYQEFRTPFVVEDQNPWALITDEYHPQEDFAVVHDTIAIPVNGVQYGAFSITNTSMYSQSFLPKIYGLDTSYVKIDLYETPFVATNRTRLVVDPLLPLRDSLILSPGTTKMLFYKIKGIKTVKSYPKVLIQNKNKSVFINLSIEIMDFAFPREGFSLNTNVWAYLNYPMLRNRKKEAAIDLYSHHINTIVVPPQIVQTDITKTDFDELIDYISYFEGIKNILIFTNYKSTKTKNGGYKGGQFLSEEWKSHFVIWYQALEKTIRQNGFPHARVYLYPYDEIREPKDVKDYKALINWSKKAIPGIKYFATLGDKKAAEDLIPMIDIAQLNLGGKIDEKIITTRYPEVWFYKNTSSSRRASPYEFYRLKAWKAFAWGFAGVGFWNYALENGSSGNLNLINESDLPPGQNFSVIYTTLGKEIISSRRWEAFKLGVEDYQILKAYEKKFGQESAKQIAEEVLKAPDDYNKADKIIIQILRCLNI